MANTTAEITWLTYILKDLRIPLSSPPTLYCDNLSALYMTINPVFHARSKHIELDYHFVHERVALGLLVTKHVSTAKQIADIFTKPLSKADFRSFYSKLCLLPRLSLRGDISRVNSCTSTSNISNQIVSKWSDKVSHKLWSDKDEFTHNNNSISGDILGDNRGKSATTSVQDGNLIKKSYTVD